MKKFESFDIEDPFGEESKENSWSSPSSNRLKSKPVPPPLELYHYNTVMTIENPIVHQVHRNEYKIVIRAMHGDADGYTNNTIYEEDKERVIKIYDYLKWARRADRRLFGRMWKLAFPEDEYEDMLYDLLPGDATCDGQYRARPTRVTVTYFDDNGIEYSVNFH